MLATILLLAQIVQSWPWLDSPLVQPGPTICVGECAGPVVWGPAERGRLVVACDMRSDTCSDGRRITTQRATPVPCETSPGVWEMVPENTGCYSVRGLEAWAANTSYLSYGAQLDREPWGPTHPTVDIQPIGGGAVRVCNTTEPNSGIGQYLGNLTEPGIATGSIIARVAPPITGALIGVFQGVFGVVAHPGPVGSWAQLSFTGEGAEGVRQQLIVYPRPSSADRIDCIDIMAAWRTKTATPGRPCWGGEAPVTCAGDRHSISTDGWPTESGEISVTFRAGPPTSGDNAIIESRDNGTILFSLRRLASDGRIRLITSGPTLDGASVAVGDTAHVRVVRNGSTVSLWVNGSKSAESGGMPAWVWSSTATLGINHAGPSLFLNGSISSLTVRSYEEVSP